MTIAGFPQLAQGTGLPIGRPLESILQRIGTDSPERLFGADEGVAMTHAQLAAAVGERVEWLRAAGTTTASRVLVALPNSLEHIVTVLAVLKLRALWVPVNTKLPAASIDFIRRNVGATHLITAARDGAVSAKPSPPTTVLAGEARAKPAGAGPDRAAIETLPTVRGPDIDEAAAAVMYTSGTTGTPKGVTVTAPMLMAAACGALEVTTPNPGDRFLVWEPLHHIGGAQLMLLPFLADISLHVRERFSVSRFWTDVATSEITHFHYLGGILDMLLAASAGPHEREHRVRCAWGAGARQANWAAAKSRYGIGLHECYGSTETASIVTVNHEGPAAGVGRAVPWFDIEISGQAREGEIVVHERVPGLITPGYVGHPAATPANGHRAAWHTGDYGWLDGDGSLHFSGRGSERIRVRGENVSARAVEQVLLEHDRVVACAVVGVPAAIGEDEILALVVPAAGQEPPTARELVAHAAEQLAVYQVPRYVKLVDTLPRSSTGRVAKHLLNRALDGAVDAATRDELG